MEAFHEALKYRGITSEQKTDILKCISKCQFQLRQFDEAKAVLDKAKAIADIPDAKRIEILILESELLCEQKKYDESKDLILKLIETEKSMKYTVRDKLYLDLGNQYFIIRKNREEALKYYRLAAESKDTWIANEAKKHL